MIVRLVKMTFQPQHIETFIKLFQEQQQHIVSFEGCIELKLLRDSQNPHVFFTYSMWRSETHLNDYRNSDFFKNIWQQAKSIFSEKAEAWTLSEIAANQLRYNK